MSSLANDWIDFIWVTQQIIISGILLMATQCHIVKVIHKHIPSILAVISLKAIKAVHISKIRKSLIIAQSIPI